MCWGNIFSQRKWKWIFAMQRKKPSTKMMRCFVKCLFFLIWREEFQEKKIFSSLVCIGKKAVLLVLTVAFSHGHYSGPQAQFLPRRISYLVNYMLMYVLKISLYYMCSTPCWVEITADNKGRKAKKINYHCCRWEQIYNKLHLITTMKLLKV